jgi:hypothetical protein
MVRSRSEYYTSMSVSGLSTFLISVKNMNLLSSSIYKQLTIEIYSLPVSTANGIKFRFIKVSDRDLKFVYLNRIGRSINHIISLKICKECSDWIILPKLTNQNNSIIRTLKWIVNKRKFLYSVRNGFSTCTHVWFLLSNHKNCYC